MVISGILEAVCTTHYAVPTTLVVTCSFIVRIVVAVHLQVTSLKCTKNRFGCRSALDVAGELRALPVTLSPPGISLRPRRLRRPPSLSD